MLFLNRHEKIFILFLIFGFLAGMGIHLYRQSQPVMAFDIQAREDVEQFIAMSQQIQDEDEAVAGKNNITKFEEKKSLIGKVNINTATLTELQSLPRIGPSTAKKIVDYRNQNGYFKTINEITKIKGIGKKTFEKIKPNITVN